MQRSYNCIDWDKCIIRTIYKLNSRNLSIGVYDGINRFIGIRTKFNNRFLDSENHYDAHEQFGYGTACPIAIIGILPENINLQEYNGSIDQITKRMVEFDKPIDDGGRGWYYLDTGEGDVNIRSMRIFNKELFDYLDNLQNKMAGEQ